MNNFVGFLKECLKQRIKMSATDKLSELKTGAVKDFKTEYFSWFKEYLKIFCKRAFEWSVVYMFGYYTVSFGWLVAPLFLMVLREKRAKEKKLKFDIIRSLTNTDEKDFLQEVQKFANLPSWVTWPDMERVEWLNKMLRKLWPYAGHYTKDLCKNVIEPAIQDALKAYKINFFKFENIILGDTPPRITGIKVYDTTSRQEIILDADFVYAGDCKFEVAVAKIKGGIKDLQISGRARIVMKPLVRQIPLVGGLQVFFLNNPEVDFNLIGVADVFDVPGLSDILRIIVIEQIANMMVLPNRFPIQLVEDIDVAELKYPKPQGVIRVELIEASNLLKKDIGVLGTGKSDPYCIVRLGAQKFQTKTINNTVKPVWDFVCEAVVNAYRNQSMTLECWDEDFGSVTSSKYDDFLGRALLDVESIYLSGTIDMWVPLSEVKSGQIHVRATWLYLTDELKHLDMQLAEIKRLQPITKEALHSSILMVWIDSAKNLPSVPDAMVRMRVGNKQMQTSVKHRSNNPIFEEGFSFLVNPQTEDLKIEMVDNKTNVLIGKLQVDLNSILKKNNMEALGEEYSFKSDLSGMAAIKMSLSVRILHKSLVEEVEQVVSEANTETSPLIKESEQISKNLQEIPVISTEKYTATLQVALKGTETENGEIQTVQSVNSSFPQQTADNVDTSVRKRTVSNASGSHNLGRIQVTVTYGARNNLVIVVHKIEGLQMESESELPDPYVKMYLLPDKAKESKRKTEVIKDTLSPVFDERFEYSVAPNELSYKTIQVLVVNKKGFMKRIGVMGEVMIDCSSLNTAETTRWFDIAPFTDED